MACVSTTAILAMLFLYFTGCTTITFKSKTHKPESTSPEISEGFYFLSENVFAENGTFSSDNTTTIARGKELKMEELSKSTLDEKCDGGLPISASWQYYGPYAKSSTKMNSKLGVEGIFPHLINKMLNFCCNMSTVVSYGKIIKSIRKLEGQLDDPQAAYDLTFPITGISEDDKTFKDLQFIPVVQAPRVALLVLDKDMTDQTSQLLMTVTKAWPILVFIIVAATLSGMIIWALDRLKNPDEFPPPFISGTWEGFWWAFVTMTTVGYGDRAPKSLLARVFCIVWILVGIIIIAIFTAIITASLSASIQHHFTVHGSKVGAVSGSEEQRLGVSLNADMIPYQSIPEMNKALLNQTLNGSLIDNYVLTHYSDYIKFNPVRIETTYNHPITYGIVLRDNSSKMVECFRSYVRNHPQEVFEIIAKNLQPLINPTDAESQEVKASRELFFYREPSFKFVLHVLLSVVGFLLLFGALWELLYRKPKARQLKAQRSENPGTYLALSQMRGGNCDCHEMMLNHQTIQAIKDKSIRIKELIKEYEEFYEKWLTKVRDVERDDNGHITPNMV
ncbi:uncharacterized protein LOC116293260 [Actinia tenebrosa]|uniref:Uncharacterized protein LOC116293260 n=1 Tax=Actinia tenebrosa TaxID=6105 RepID=A0A6P8HVB0_ACTTE|nr:uncharacterized protein LOC116293260 [Actinia tenebrosa]XP_031556523.1 uncharacterized protein LOC116293260 [Actinia tenebrosa]XP_031556524.1 uncharacterized protein LOC116293260 [Actinia tenebrosa]XP_031556525.1 uncharacterized protein LOC116293260 [Actinia tenebrosa]XP_031556526.1 uncharacterized protein LOC116293260 [Actinia tenebrosa]XP_031556527.1 uncharacterized protein LOC116293260 [Actinia tenebrosa]